MKRSTADIVRGKANEAAGALKQKAGRATDNPRLHDEGTAQKAGGKVDKKVGQIKKVFNG